MSAGGVRSGKEALQRIKDGADIVSIYTPLFTEGPYVVSNILRDMQQLMREEGISSV